jgi:hypothetical protein
MTAQIQFFCTPDEERAVIDHLSQDPVTSVFLLDDQRIRELPEFSAEQLPAWPEFICLYMWAKEFGPLRWHSAQPTVEGATHRSFVTRLFAREDWDRFGLDDGDRLLDQDLSPGICYKRAEHVDGRTGPCTLIAPPSRLERAGVEYASWVKRCVSWIRRRGTKVHDWKVPSPRIPNPRGLLNTVYAFPEAARRLEAGDHAYAIL